MSQRMDEFMEELIAAYEPESLVTILEVSTEELMTMLVQVYPEKLEEMLYKINEQGDSDYVEG